MITYRDDGGPDSMDFDSNHYEVAPRHSANPNPWRRVPRGCRLVNPVLPSRESRMNLHAGWALAAACALVAMAWTVVPISTGVDAPSASHRMV